MNNMELYENFRAVPDWAKKQITGGRMNGKTDISPMWRIQALTEVFGPCGYGWRYEIMSQRLETAGKEIKAFSDECFKMALTDAISVAAKALGVGADVYMGCDQTKYTASGEDNSPPPQQQTPPPPQQRRQEPAPQNPQPTTYFTCARCGRKLTPYNDSNGRPVSLRAHAEKSMQVFGEVLCLDCMPK